MIIIKPFKLFGFEFRVSILNKNDSCFYPTNKLADEILRSVAHKHGLSVQDLKGVSRKCHIKKARWEAMFEIRHNTDMTFQNIGKIFNRDHSTIMYAVKKLEWNANYELKKVV